MNSKKILNEIRAFKPYGYDNDEKEEYALSGTLNDYLQEELDVIEKDLDKLEQIKKIMFNLLLVDNRPVKGTTKKECYSALQTIQKLLQTNEMSAIFEECKKEDTEEILKILKKHLWIIPLITGEEVCSFYDDGLYSEYDREDFNKVKEWLNNGRNI